MDILAEKTFKDGKVLKQRFSEHAWNLLGANKQGFVEVSSKTDISNKTVAPALNTGQRIENVVSKKKGSKPEGSEISNELNKTESSISNEKKPEEKSPVLDDAKKEEFMTLLEGFNKSKIKDFFDDQNPSIEYKNSDSLDVLKVQLAEHLKYDSVLLQKSFGA